MAPIQRRIYVASSWRNGYQIEVVRRLRAEGYDVYDFRNPRPGDDGFQWESVDPAWKSWGNAAYRSMLGHSVAERGFANDYDAIQWADTCVLLLPCGRSAHLEAGYFVGAGKELFILLSDQVEPELMYKMADAICLTLDELVTRLAVPQ